MDIETPELWDFTVHYKDGREVTTVFGEQWEMFDAVLAHKYANDATPDISISFVEFGRRSDW